MHMHNVRCKWVRLTAPGLEVPAQLNRTRCTPQHARATRREGLPLVWIAKAQSKCYSATPSFI
jgi:hypothetical protein